MLSRLSTFNIRNGLLILRANIGWAEFKSRSGSLIAITTKWLNCHRWQTFPSRFIAESAESSIRLSLANSRSPNLRHVYSHQADVIFEFLFARKAADILQQRV